MQYGTEDEHLGYLIEQKLHAGHIMRKLGALKSPVSLVTHCNWIHTRHRQPWQALALSNVERGCLYALFPSCPAGHALHKAGPMYTYGM